MKNKEKKIVRLLEEGFSYETVKKMSNYHIDKIFKSIVKEAMVSVSADKFDDIKDKLGPDDKVEVTEETPLDKDAEQVYTGQEMPHDADDMAPDGMDDDSDNNRKEMGEEFDDDRIIDLLFGPKKKWDRSPESRAEKAAKKDIKPHYFKSGDPNEFDVESSAEYAIGLEDPSFMMYEGKKKKKTPPTTLGMFEGEISEKSVSQQQQKLMGLALSVKRGETPKSGVSKKVLDMVNSMTEKELEDFASTKHKGLPKKKKKESKEEKIRQIEESIVSLIKKSQGKMITKGDLLSEQPSIAPSKPTVKPGTKPERGTPYQPKHSPKPKAGTEVKPARPTVKPGTKPERGTPYQPKHSPKPKAGTESELPEFLKFNNLNIQFRDE
jgi:hypothetical protein